MASQNTMWDGRGRAPFQVLVLPYRRVGSDIQFAVFRRADAGCWQFIAGGGEGGELPMEAARREACEEAAVPADAHLFPLDARSMIPVLELAGWLRWGPEVLVVSEYAFAVEVCGAEIRIGREHTEFRWVDYETCCGMLRWEGNRSALRELRDRACCSLGRSLD